MIILNFGWSFENTTNVQIIKENTNYICRFFIYFVNKKNRVSIYFKKTDSRMKDLLSLYFFC